jgi:hypothetical protein
MKVNAKNKEELIKEAVRVSKENPGKYVLASTVFNEAYCDLLSSISYKWVDRTKLGGYFKNGKFVKFSQKLIVQYNNKGLCDD